MASLVIVAHGSLKNPESSTPCHEHAETIGRLGLFDRVLVGFWKEEPSLSRVLHAVGSDDEVCVVPFFMAEGYFSRVVIPRELAAAEYPGQVTLCQVVGTHPRVTDAILERVEAAQQELGLSPDALTVVIVGHGTMRNKKSAATVMYQVAQLEQLQRFAAVKAGFLDQPPMLEMLPAVLSGQHLVVVPMFAADGFHTFDQIPEILGLQTGALPTSGVVDGRQIWCASAIGRTSVMVDIILERVQEARALPVRGAAQPRAYPEVAQVLGRTATCGVSHWGQVRITSSHGEGWCLGHVDDDAEDPDLVRLEDLESLRRWCREDEAGGYRSLSTALTLRSGWRFEVANIIQCGAALDAIYPGRLAEQSRLQHPPTAVPSLRQVAERHTGAFGNIKSLSDAQLQAVVDRVCLQCICQRHWSVAEATVVSQALCPSTPHCAEPCPVLLEMLSLEG